MQARIGSNSFSNGHSRNNFRNSMSAEKLFEKYSTLSKEAMTTGDKILSENYLQHADHFMRIINDRNKIQNENKEKIIDKPIVDSKSLSEVSTTNQNQSVKDKE